MKWYRKVAFDIMLNVSVINALSIYKTVTSKTCTITSFKENIVKALTSKHHTPYELAVNQEHVFVPNKCSRCPFCYKKRVRDVGRKIAQQNVKKTSAECNQCGVMCRECFFEKHSTRKVKV